jgi:hypothetical protein
MSDNDLTMPKHLSEIQGTADEMRKTKVALIAKFGFEEYEKLMARSSRFHA